MGEVLTALRPGQILAGKYRVERVLGAGGMGIVVAAHHLGLDTRVAVKLLLPEMMGQPEVVARFAREARAAARITSEHVARVFDVGALEDGAPYIVMEFLEGSDLRQWLEQRGPLPIPQAVDFVMQACEAVAEAHGLGIVHRDLKPANLFCVPRSDGSVCIKVLDFGISKLAGGGSLAGFAMTSTSAVMGTPFYMSPEQMESARTVDGRSDIWALGIILFELLTGGVPFTGETLPEVCVKIATHTPPSPRERRGDVPPELDAVILRCLEKDRNKRFANVAEFSAALAAVLLPAAALAVTGIANSGVPVLSSARLRRVGPITPVPGGPVPAGLAQLPLAPTSFGAASRESLGPLGNTKHPVPRKATAVIGIASGAVALVVVAVAIFVAVRPASPGAQTVTVEGFPAAGSQGSPPSEPGNESPGALRGTVATTPPAPRAPLPTATLTPAVPADGGDPVPFEALPKANLVPPSAPSAPARESAAAKPASKRKSAAAAAPSPPAGPSPAPAPALPAREPAASGADPFGERL
ncbi:MAG: protein kinase [Myxococcales bacterium]|nr:protein kinase [Myxococcales bacterium]